ncbi:LOW QUALITY PROTEIN: protein polybromo-1-like [Dendronephthya gigantea]|uniref:LOW QUALITY PROTEIN: protein polybromo-1-like n=1 Tax=Dendronephthya gigantea TaxID=151771 RepID=UPI00106C00D9|nr:LOW QUALITY PROTEIN: protein polybromo-1-like [Dendronephthya gigantea]
MSKRRREAEANEKSSKVNPTSSDSVEEKRAKVFDDDEVKNADESFVTGSPDGFEELRPQRGQSKKSESLSDLEERPELISQKSLDGDDSASDMGSVMEETNSHLYQDLLDAVLKMKDNNGRMICELFLKLPPRQQYPEYYRVIKEPIDLKMIYSQVKNNGYASMDEIERDLNLLVKNAHAFNEPGSQVYKDATAIKKTVVTKRLEIEHTLSGAKSSKRLRSKRSTSKMSFAINALLSESDDEEEDLLNDATQLLEEDEGNKKPDGDSEDPFLTLYNSVRIYSDYSGRILSEAFMRLPSKRAYPDYYEIIKNPIGLLRIGSNIKNNYYESLDVLVAEINQCFENAKIFNETESMLYQDAVTLQDILKTKKSEVEKMCQSKGIPLTRAVSKKIPKTSEQTPSEEGDVETKETPVSGGKALSKKPGKKQSENEAFKKRMKELYNAVEKYQDENGRLLSELFLELPSASLYPDYYEIITEPTCLHMIEKNIREGKYQTEQQFLLDFEIMFENAKHYNEVGSQVHQDALTLDKVLKKKRKSLGRPLLAQVESGTSPSITTKQLPASNKQTTPTKSRSSSGRTYQAGSSTDVKELCKELYNSVKDYTDNTGRYLCGIFQKLPSKADYPDYYALIKRPIDMTKISGKFHADQYSTLEECFQDFVLMFDNACKYNDPDSQVYKDSLVLLRELLATKLELLGDCELRVPDVPDLVQKMLEDLYNSIIHHQDDEGRCYSDSLLKLASVEEVNEAGEKRNILTLSTIGKLIQKRYYKRLDKLQEDLYAFFENARTHRSDTEVYDDAVELQQFYVQQRDRVCKDGERFVSPAISQTKRHLQHELDEERKRKTREEASDTVDVANDEIGLTELPEIKLGDLEIAVGDFVHVEDNGDRFIIGIEKMWTDKAEMKWIRGTWFYRPEQTLCDGSRKFIEKEVVRSDRKSAIKVNQIKGRCYVMHIKNYIRSKPHDFEDDDIYVCECSYNVGRKSFKKIKSWPGGHGHTMRYVPREQPLPLKRSPLDPSKTGLGESNDEDLITSLFQATEERKSLQIEVPNSEGYINYEQFWTDSGCYKLGDTVFCQTDEGYSSIARIDKIWTDRSGMTYFCGTTFIKPDDTQHLPTHMFYDKEVFHVPVDDVHRMCDIERKCFVLPIREYMRCRPTDVPEEDVFLCESRYDEDDGGHYRKLKGLKRPTLSTSVYEEEFHFFEENLNLVKKPSPLLVKDLSELRRDDRIVSPSSSAGDGESNKGTKKRSRAQSGFLLFSTERRGVLRKQYPDYGFGDISRLVGTEWKNLSPMKREEWESRGNSQATSKAPITSPSAYFSAPGLVYDCLWQGCDYQYENLSELIIHVLESGGHLIKMDNGICPCVWRNCERLKRGMRPFNSLTKLIRHCREVHLKGPPRRVEIHERSKNFFPKNQAPVQLERPSPSPVSTNQNQGPGNNQAFVGVVPSPTPSQVLGGGLATVNINPGLLDQQFSNVMRMPTPGLAQNMMSLTNSFGNQGMSPLSAQSTANLQRSPSVMTGSPIPPTAVNQFTQMPNMGTNIAQQQFANTLQQFSSVYQQQQQQQSQQLPQLQQQPDQLPPPFTPNMPPAIPPQPTQITQSRPQAPPMSQPTMFPIQRPQAMDTQTTEVQMTPLFHSPPPRQQKLLHSDAYLRYIEGLRDGTPHLSNWNPNKPDVTKLTPQQQSQLPVQWLGSAYNPHPSTVDALWALREHMLNDALKLAKFSHKSS